MKDKFQVIAGNPPLTDEEWTAFMQSYVDEPEGSAGRRILIRGIQSWATPDMPRPWLNPIK